MDARLGSRVAVLLAEQARGIEAELEWIDRRLAELGGSDEDRVEAIVLYALKRHLENELDHLNKALHWNGPSFPEAALHHVEAEGGGAAVRA
ncbi:hypothetical protein [Stetteria hydrogenophila]